jgi:cellulose synthase/poly-beta-1,6-N-acetylglucosamine synthase-like glycosyltransferase
MSWLTAMGWVNAVVGVTLATLLLVFRRRYSLARWLDGGVSGSTSVTTSVSVVIAARNEEGSVERTLREFAALPGVAEVILVDDGSEDNTLKIARAVAAQESRVSVMEAPPLPQGWIGKTHALHWATKHAGAEYILFTDADVHLHQLPLQQIVCRMGVEHLDHVGGNFRIEQASFSEALTAPVLGGIAFVALGLSASRSGSSTGAFNLVRTSAYRQMSGHLPVRDHVVDDVALARCMKSRGFRCRFMDVSPVLSVRLFRGWRGFVAAVSRSAVPFLGSWPLLALALSLIGVVLASTLLFIPFWLLASLTAGSAMELPRLCGVASIAYCCSVLPFVVARWLHSRSRWWGLASPIGLLTMTAAVVVAAIRCMLGLRVRWRGRVYPHSGYTHS